MMRSGGCLAVVANAGIILTWYASIAGCRTGGSSSEQLTACCDQTAKTANNVLSLFRQ